MMKKVSYLLLAVFALPMFLVGCNSNPTGSLGEGQLVMVYGFVYDNADRPLPSATVTLTNADLTFTKSTDSQGRYWMYTRLAENRNLGVSVSAQGFASQEVSVPGVPDTRVAVPDFKLEPAQ